jgi:TP901 family phage tail tape measure protein
MATELPGIKARAEFDLALFKQQEEQIKASLRAVAQAMRDIPQARVQFDTKSGQSAEASVARVRAASEKLQQSQEQSARQMAATAERLARQQADARIREDRRATDAVNRSLRAQVAAEERAMRETNSALARSWTQRQQMAERARKEEERAAARIASAGSAQERRDARLELPIGVALGAGGAAIALQIKDATKASAEFEKAMSQVRAVLSADEWARTGAEITKLARDLGAAGLGTTATQAATALEAMSKAGISATDQLKGAPAVLALAAAGSIEVAEAANFAAIALQTFKLGGAQLEAVSNTIVGVANATILSVDDIRLSFQQAGAVAALQGRNFDSLAVAIGLMGQAGIKSSDAGTALRTFMQRLTPDTEKAAQTMQAFGIIVNGQNRFIDASTGAFKDYREVAQILSETLGHLSKAEQDAALNNLFGQDAYRTGAVLLAAGAEGYDKLTKAALGNASAIDVARIRLDNLLGDLTNLNAAWENARITFGKAIEPNLRPLAQQLTALLNVLKDVTPQVATTTAVVGGALAAFLALTGVAVGVTAAFAITGAMLATVGISIAAIAAPIALVVAGVTALGVAWVNNWGDIQGKTQEAGKVIGDVLSELGANADALASVFGNAKDSIVASLESIISNEVLQNFISGGKELALGFVEGFVNLIQDLFEPLVEGLLLASGLKAVQVAASAVKDRIDQERAANKSRRQTEAQTALTPNMMAADLGRVAESFIAQAPDLTKGLEAAFALAFANISTKTTDDEILAITTEWANSVRQGFSDAFGGAISGDAMDAIVERLFASFSGIREKVTAEGEAAATNYADKWATAFKKINENANDVGRALSMAGDDTELIKVLIDIGDAAKASDKGFRDLADRGLAAALIAQRNLANDMQESEEKTKRLIEIGQQYDAHLAAQGKSAQDAADQQKLANEIAAIGPKVTEDRLRSLIETVYPQLTVEQEAHVKRVLAEEGAYKAYQFAIVAAGGKLEDFNTIMGRTGAEAAEAEKELKKFFELSDPNRGAKLGREKEQSFFDQISKDAPVAERAMLDLLAHTEGPVAAIRAIWQGLGLDISKLPDIANATSNQMQKALELANRVRNPEIDREKAAKILTDAGEKYREAGEKARASVAEANEKIAKELEKARTTWSKGVQAAGETLGKAREKFVENIAKIRANLDTELAKIARGREDAIAQLAKQLRDIGRQEDKAFKQYSDSTTERNRAFNESSADRRESFEKANKDAAETLAQAIADSMDRLRDGITQSLRQTSDTIRQEVSRMRSASEAREDASLAGFNQDYVNQQKALMDVNRRAAEEGEQAMEAIRQVERARGDAAKAAEKERLALIRTIKEAEKAKKEREEQFEKEQKRAQEADDRALEQAEKAYDLQLEQFAQQRKDADQQHSDRMAEFDRQEQEARTRAAADEARARRELDEAERQHLEEMQKLQDQLDLADRLAAEEMQAANDKFQLEMAVAENELNEARRAADALTNIDTKMSRANVQLDQLLQQRHPIEINMSNMNVEEGDVEFIERSMERAEELAQSPIG